ncbi:MAG: hypothetical protein L3J89_09330 [Gammaproteobacteria bacterium]|nr:hypothetical protein [Gammaproteobacteria bacterium]
MFPLNLPSRLAALPLILMVLVLPGCFHNDDDPAPVSVPDANPVGYYIIDEANVSDGNNGMIAINDLQAIVHDSRMMMMSIDNGLLYDGTITDITENSFTADVIVYKDGVNIGTATASGTITEGSSITGQLVGSGFGSGTFSLTYALSNNRDADLSRVENTEFFSWRGEEVTEGFDFEIDGQGNVIHSKTPGSSSLYDTCKMNGTIAPVDNATLYVVDVILSQCNVNDELNGAYKGLAVTKDDRGIDDHLVYMISNTVYAYFGGFYED